MTYKQISETYGIPDKTVRTRIQILGLLGKGVTRDYDDWEVQEIVDYTPPKKEFALSSKKLDVLGLLPVLKNNQRVGRYFNVTPKVVKTVIDEAESGFVVVESKLNHPLTIKQHGKEWILYEMGEAVASTLQGHSQLLDESRLNYHLKRRKYVDDTYNVKILPKLRNRKIVISGLY